MLTNLSGPIIMILLATIVLFATIVFIFGKRQILRFTLKSKREKFIDFQGLLLIFMITDTTIRHTATRASSGRSSGDLTSLTSFTMNQNFSRKMTNSS